MLIGKLFQLTLPVLSSGFQHGSDLLKSSHFPPVGVSNTFDYIVVGGGTAGLAVAKRLGDEGFSVAIVEAGDFSALSNGNASQIPAAGAIPSVQRSPLSNWNLSTTHQPQMLNRTIQLNAARAVGGSSTNNDLWYHRSSVGAYDVWAQLTGDESFRFAAFREYMERGCSFTKPSAGLRFENSTPGFDPKVCHEHGGPLQIGFPNFANAISTWLGHALSQVGLASLTDVTSGNISGWAWVSNTIQPGRMLRDSAETSYLQSALQSLSDVSVYRNTVAKRIIFGDHDNSTAVGIELESAGVPYELKTSKEIIISAGALLMASGIGPRRLLESLNIPVMKDLPGVGRNLQDHLLLSVTASVDLTTHTALGNMSFLDQENEIFSLNRTGMLSNVGGDILGFDTANSADRLGSSLMQDLGHYPDDWPTFEYEFPDTAATTGLPDDGAQYTSVSLSLAISYSRGNVTITSGDTADNPLVSPNWLEDTRDQQLAVAAFRRAQSFLNQSSIQPVIRNQSVFPNRFLETDEEILHFVRQSAGTSYHASCTCSMGLDNNTMAVLDANAKVRGVNGLRVVDASSFPILLPGHPVATVYGLAEKIAQDIINGT